MVVLKLLEYTEGANPLPVVSYEYVRLGSQSKGRTVVATNILITFGCTRWHNMPNTVPIILLNIYVCTPNLTTVIQLGAWDSKLFSIR